MTGDSGARWAHAERVAAVGLLLAWLARWPFRARYLYEWDSGQFALGALEFDVYKHQPHPPGYPLWILLLKGLHLVLDDLNLAQILLAFLLVGASAVVFYLLARGFHGRLLAILATTALLCAPPVVMYGLVASTYPVDLLISSTVGLLAARLWRGDKRLAVVAAALLGLFAGLRQSGAVLMAPLLALALVRACRHDRRLLVKAAVAGVTAAAAWYVPTALMHGGIFQYQRYLSAEVQGYFGQMSWFYGAPAAAHRAMLDNVGHWALIALLPAALVALVAAAAARVAARSRGSTPAPRTDPGFLFYAAWILPNLVYVTAFHCPKPGYLLLGLPPVVLACFALAHGPVAALPTRLERKAAIATIVLAASSGWASTALAWTRWPAQVLNRSTLASVRQSDLDHGAIRGEVSSGAPGETLVISIDPGPWGPNFRTLSYHLPEAEVWMFYGAPEAIFRSRDRRRQVEYGPVRSIPRPTKRILWAYGPGAALPVSVRASFPDTRLVRAGSTLTAWVSTLSDEAIDARVAWNDHAVHFARPGRPRQAPDCQLGEGFGEVGAAGGDTLGYGPSSEIAVLLPASQSVRLAAEIASAQPGPQAVTVLLDGRPLKERAEIPGDRPLTVDFDAAAGTRVVTLRYARWNGAPDFFTSDRRPIAVKYRRITCQFDGRTVTLAP